MTIRLIALDIDGTILDRPSNLGVPLELREAVAQARAAGITVALCTSRMSFTLEDALEGTETGQQKTLEGDGIGQVDAVISASGAEVTLGEQLLQRIYLPPHLWQLALKLANHHNIFVAIGTTTEVIIRQQGAYDPLAHNDPPFLRVLPEAEIVPTLKQAQATGNGALISYLYGIKPAVMAALSAELSTQGAEVVPSGETSLVVSAKAANKGQGLLKLATHLGVSAQEIMAVGNDLNDLPMFAVAGMAVAVGNAPAKVQAQANKVVADVWHAGAAQAIRELALG